MTGAPFYVGYLKLPRGLRRPLAVLVIGLFVADLGLAVAWLRGQPAHASGAWGAGEAQFRGRFQARPYPLLRVAGADGRIGTVLLVEEGKHGVTGRALPADGSLVAATGYPVVRGDLAVLQIDRPLETATGALPDLAPAGSPVPARLAGEIVDAKCWAGAMNPGEGKAHKGCGALCLLGAIPALFIVPTADGGGNWYLMADAGGGPVRDAARTLVGEPLELSGTVVHADGMSVFTPDLQVAALR